jgi:hypothetical protein
MPQIAQWRIGFSAIYLLWLFSDGSAMIERAPDTQEVPTRVCNGCGAPMKHLVDHRSSGTHPAERIFVCDGCRSIVSERR